MSCFFRARMKYFSITYASSELRAISSMSVVHIFSKNMASSQKIFLEFCIFLLRNKKNKFMFMYFIKWTVEIKIKLSLLRNQQMIHSFLENMCCRKFYRTIGCRNIQECKQKPSWKNCRDFRVCGMFLSTIYWKYLTKSNQKI